MDMVSTMFGVDVSSTVLESRPEELRYPISNLDHGEHVVNTSLLGYPQLAADHLLNGEMRGKLVEILGSTIRKLNLEFIKHKPLPDDGVGNTVKKIRVRQRAYEALIEIALNFVGVESLTVGFSEKELSTCFKRIIYTLEKWESLEGEEGTDISVAKATTDKFLLEMKKIMHGEGMVAKMAEEIERELVEGIWTASFVIAAKKTIQNNVYYRMVTKRMCKFGNDYALGLRWLRHLGFVQVSTNPVLAAIAYDDDARLWEKFREVARQHTEWSTDPDKFGDEIAMQATMIALWPNLEVFRPIALLSKFHDGVVSYQLNPNVAASLEGSLNDALKIYSAAETYLKAYDAYLSWGYSDLDGAARPNIVFKVAGAYPAAIGITASLNSLGIGTNNTVTYAVGQEIELIMAAMKGMAEAVKKGIRPTQAYETNMGGRLESHLRDLEAEKLISQALRSVKNKESLLHNLAEQLGASGEMKNGIPLDKKIRAICGFKYLKRLTHPAFVQAITSGEVGGETEQENLSFLTRLENDIGLAGTLVAQRVYWLFFSPENRPKWLFHLQREFTLSLAEAEEVMDKIDVLPASKRKPADTFLTLGERNVTNTEFPNHQWAVAQASGQKDFNLDDYSNSIMRKPKTDALERLLQVEDFRRAYEITRTLSDHLENVGVKVDFGIGGMAVEEWSSFGSVVKTMKEFENAYENFKKRAVELVREIAKDKPR